ncbi:MAG: tetraacyldisaccharide 4'-kinase [Candidatus Omnitrophica bacterium]|nr:tetraacyldisaccharide 4'-kinase [Candidatus Omnitrophota bacterium]
MLAAIFSFFLLLASFVYKFLLRIILFCYRHRLFKTYKVACPVISVGNITWGGTGKTPMLESLVKFMRQQARKPAVLFRGYAEDEIELLQNKFNNLLVFSGKNRAKLARVADQRYGADVIILDDGFQHWRIKRDLDIVLIDASCAFGNNRLIPRGILREPLTALARADLLILTKVDQTEENIETLKTKLRRYNCSAPIYTAIHAPVSLRNLSSGKIVEFSLIKNQRLAMLCGIAQPESLQRTLEQLQAKVCLKFCFPDHYQYCQADLADIEAQCSQAQIETIVTTEKDAVKLATLVKDGSPNIELLELGIQLKISPDEKSFFNLLSDQIEAIKTYSILILSDGKSGHLNQAKAVARIIEQSKLSLSATKTSIIEVKFKNRFFRNLLACCAIFAGPRCWGCLFCLRFCLDRNSFEQLLRTPANIVVSAGSSLSAVNLFLGYQNQARKVILMKPTILTSGKFDLMIIPEHDRIKAQNNVLTTRIAPNLIDQEYLQEQAEVLKNRLPLEADIARPIIGVLLGGDNDKYSLTVELMDQLISQLKKAAVKLNGSLLVTTSRRTPKGVEQFLKNSLSSFAQCKLLVIANEGNIPEAVGGILGLSDIVVVSGESISMVSEAVSSDKYVLSFLPKKKLKATTKQELFLVKLEQDNLLQLVGGDTLFSEIERIYQARTVKKRLQDKERITQALNRIL